MNTDEKSSILNLIVKIVSRIRSEPQSRSEIERNLLLLNSYVHNISVGIDGSVYAVFSDSQLEGKND